MNKLTHIGAPECFFVVVVSVREIQIVFIINTRKNCKYLIYVYICISIVTLALRARDGSTATAATTSYNVMNIYIYISFLFCFVFASYCIYLEVNWLVGWFGWCECGWLCICWCCCCWCVLLANVCCLVSCGWCLSYVLDVYYPMWR